MTTAPTKPPVLLRPHLPLPALRPALEERFELRSEPGPGITAMVASGVVDAALMDSLPDLKLIALGTVGYDGVDLDHARRRGINVTNTPDVLTDDVADLAVALILACRATTPMSARAAGRQRDNHRSPGASVDGVPGSSGWAVSALPSRSGSKASGARLPITPGIPERTWLIAMPTAPRLLRLRSTCS